MQANALRNITLYFTNALQKYDVLLYLITGAKLSLLVQSNDTIL